MNTIYHGDDLKILRDYITDGIHSFTLGVIVLVLCSFLACGAKNENSLAQIEADAAKSQRPIPSPTIELLTSEAVLNAFSSANLPLHNIVIYTDETDPNRLLGRPNQYVRKINFADTRAKNVAAEKNPNSIEIFSNLDDLEDRRRYTEAISKSGGPFAQYIYSHKNVLLRLSHDLLPKDAAEYESILKSL
jgi:hypothetical protein